MTGKLFDNPGYPGVASKKFWGKLGTRLKKPGLGWGITLPYPTQDNQGRVFGTLDYISGVRGNTIFERCSRNEVID